MKNLLMVAFMAFSLSASADTLPVEIVEPYKTVVISGDTTQSKVDVATPVPTLDEVKLSVKDESFIPPEWLQDALMNVKQIPVVGPVLMTIFQWLGVLASILTGLFSFLWIVLKSLEGVLSMSRLYGVASKVAALQNSRLMYYLKAFTVFNAQKKDKKEGVI